MGRKTKIDWCDSSWNPVTGCLHGCEYCYARRMANRFGCHVQPDVAYPVLDRPVRNTDTYAYMRVAGISTGAIQPYPFDFTPTFHRYRLDEPQKWMKSRTIFVCSMADLFGDWVPDEWIQEVLDACHAARQHRYLFLTKNPVRYAVLYEKGIIPAGGVEGMTELWLGSSMPTPAAPFFAQSYARTFLSIEPILRPFTLSGEAPFCVDWVIVGAETGNRKSKVIPEKAWIMDIVQKCRNMETPIFMKESLRKIMGADFVQEFPWEA